MGAFHPTRDVESMILVAPNATAFSGRRLPTPDDQARVDHVVVTRAGVYLVQEDDSPGSYAVQGGRLLRSRSGPGGQWARGFEDEQLDRVRRLAETAELRLSRPVEPVVVLVGASTSAFERPVTIRGVTVVHLRHFRQWLRDLPDTLDRADFAITVDQVRRSFRTAPASGAATSPSPPRDTTSIRSAPGPRDWAPSDQWMPGESSYDGGRGRTQPVGRRTVVAGAPSARRSKVGPAILVASMIVIGSLLVAPDAVRSLVRAVGEAAARLTSDDTREAASGADVSWSPDSATGEVAPHDPAAAPPAAVPVQPPVPIPSCGRLTASDLSALLGQTVHLLDGSDDTACHFGPSPEQSAVVWVSVALGPSSTTLTRPGVNGSTVWTHEVGRHVSGGRTLATQVSVSLDPALYPFDLQAPQLLVNAVLEDLATPM